MKKNFIASPGPQQRSWEDSDRLDSWKEIASYLRREVRTVQLWEKKEGLPVHRHFHQHLGSVFAFRSEIESWRREVSRTRSSAKITSQSVHHNHKANRIAICVPPLENLSARAECQPFCNTITAKTVAGLEQLNPGQLTVLSCKPTTQTEPGASNRIPDSEIAHYVLQWNIEGSGEALKVNVALVCSDTERVVWSQTYHKDTKEWDDLPAHIGQEISQCLWLKMVYRPGRFVAERQCQQMDAREAYLKGRYFWEQRSEDGLRKAVRYFKSAIHQEPQFALPYSGLADSLTLLSFYEILPSSQVMPSARCAALKAVELNPNLAEAHASLADVLLHFDRDWQGAEHEYRRTIECNPGYALGYHWYSNLLAARGQHDAAQIAIMNALEIDPVSVITLVWAGVTSYLAHRFDDAIKHYQNALELDPHFVWAHMYMAQALEQKGDLKGALREFDAAIHLARGNNCVKAMKAHAHAIAGDKASAREILRELKRTSSPECMPCYDIAATYAALGEPTRMIAWLNRACQERNMKLFTLPQDPRFDPFRSRPEFKEITGQMGLTRM
jgi:tetratricopeptide (TPR) repeat protein/TolB-like protein